MLDCLSRDLSILRHLRRDRLQAVCYERGKNCLSIFERVFPTKIDVDSMFTSQAALYLWFRVFHLRERTLKFMDVCICVLRDCISTNRCNAHSRLP